jgi:hypothetical protein
MDDLWNEAKGEEKPEGASIARVGSHG